MISVGTAIYFVSIAFFGAFFIGSGVGWINGYAKGRKTARKLDGYDGPENSCGKD